MSELARRDLLVFGLTLVASRTLGGCAPAKSSATPADGAKKWPTGGTAAMRDRARYPNPFVTSAPDAPHAAMVKCTCQLTEGPCYSAQSETIQDISYGYDGVPMRLYFQVTDEAGAPVPQATVDVWHVSAAGKYSGNDAAHEDVSFCTGDDPAFSEKLYFRGKQTTDARGHVFFDSCFPGWYHGRTVHVHLTISVGGKAFVTTQLGFDDALTDAILGDDAIYASRGARDTTNANDGVFDPRDVAAYQLATAQMSDGAMLAWKTIVLRKSLTEPICGDAGGPPRGPGGPPPHGMRPPPRPER